MPLKDHFLLRVTVAVGLVLFAASARAGQTPGPAQKHESVVVNIEVPVRVLRNNVLVEGLTLADFEVLEDGVPQKVEAVYLITSDRDADPATLAAWVRSHWETENRRESPSCDGICGW